MDFLWLIMLGNIILTFLDLEYEMAQEFIAMNNHGLGYGTHYIWVFMFLPQGRCDMPWNSGGRGFELHPFSWTDHSQIAMKF